VDVACAVLRCAPSGTTSSDTVDLKYDPLGNRVYKNVNEDPAHPGALRIYS
jgi:hypothetical protein